MIASIFLHRSDHNKQIRRKLTILLVSIALLVSATVASYMHLRSTSSGLSSFSKAGAIDSDSTGSDVGRSVRDASGVARSRPLTKTEEAYGHLPLSFAANEGQSDAQVRFLARGQGYGLFLTSTGAVLSLSKTFASKDIQSPETERPSVEGRSVLSMELQGAERQPQIYGLDELPGKLNYFIGNDPHKWRKDVPTYSRVRYQNAYPGVDVIYYGNQRQLEYDFVVAAGSDPRRIKLVFSGASSVVKDESGDLVLNTPAGEVRQRKPLAYQEVSGERREIAANYRVDGDKVSFDLGSYDQDQPLIIDPVLIYSTFLGGSNGEQGLGIAVDAQGSAYLTGSTSSTDFPVAGAYQSVKDFGNDAFVVKLNPAGTAFVYATFLGANGDDGGNAIAVDTQGSAYVAGFTGSSSFPRTLGTFQDTKDGGVDGFVTKLSPSGSSLIYSTFLGGDNFDIANGIAVGSDGRAYVVGRTDSIRFRSFIPLQRHGSPAYKSVNSGGNWAATDAELTGSTVNTFAIDPGNSNTVYAGSNIGVFKSIDAGAHWNLTGTARTSTAPIFTNTVIVDPSNANIVYAGTSSGVYKSSNAGSLYDVKSNGFLVPSINALAIEPNTPTTLYAGTAFGIYKSTNGGDTWVELTNGIPGFSRVTKVVVDPMNPAIVYVGTNRGMFRSTNGGDLWTSINAGALSTSFPPQISALTIDPLNPSTLYAAGFNGTDILFKTTDSGATWIASGTGLTKNAVNNLAVDPVTPATIYAATTNTAIYKSTDGGANWSQSNTGLANATTLAVAVDRNNPNFVYAGTTIGADAFAVKLDPSASSAEYLLSFGGNENDDARGVALDADGNAYIVGSTNSQNFPVQNAFQSTLGGFSDAFVTKLNTSGTGFVYSTYLGGSNGDQGRAIAVRGNSAYLTGLTSSPDFPLANAFKSTLTQFDTDAFVSKLSPSGTSLDFSSYLGGSSVDQGLGIAVDATGGIYVAGFTSSSDFPSVAAPQPSPGGSGDAFLTKLGVSGASIAYSTYLGGVGSDQGNGVAVDTVGNAYVIGTTSSANFPTVNPLQSSLMSTDAFVSKVGVEADLAISKKESRDPVMLSNPLTYTLNVDNHGPSPATGVKVTDALPSGVTFGSATPTQGTCSLSGTTVTCDLGVLPAFAQATITLGVTPTTTGTITNVASVTGNEPDSNTANNTASETTKISASPSINGRVRDANGIGVSGVLMTLSGSQSTSTTTDSNGFYQFAELPAGGTYVVTPTKDSLSFDPPSQSFNALGADQTANFVASTCTYSIAPISQDFGAAGGSGSVGVTTLHDCPWTAVSSAPWISITSGSSGVGNGTVKFTVSAATAPRAGHITVAGKNFAVYQEFDSCGAPSFSISSYSAADLPTEVQVADLNGDGWNDIVLANGGGLDGGGSLKFTVLLNDGQGVFATTYFQSGFGGLLPFVVADFNGDGKPDIALPGYFSPSIRIFFNNGSGGFGQLIADIPYTSQGQSLFNRTLFAVDVNHDGNVDMLVSSPNSKGVQVLLGNGNGGFSQLPQINPSTNLALISVADVNHDLKPDLIFGGYNSSGSLVVMLGDGSGGFGAGIVSTVTDVISRVATGDFDDDGNLDLAVSGGTISSYPNISPALIMMSGDGTGHFTKKSIVNLNQIGSLTAADFDNDGKLDVAFNSGSTQVTLLEGDGVGGFGTPLQVNTPGNANYAGNSGIVAADLNGDSRPDLAIANYEYSAFVLKNKCAAAPSIEGQISDPQSVSGGLEGVKVTLSGAKSATTQTDAGGHFVFDNLEMGANYVVTPTKDNFRFSPASRSVNNLSGVQTAYFDATPIFVAFDFQVYQTFENAGSIQIRVYRSGDLSGVTTVDYATVDDIASARTDYTSASGTLKFEAGEISKSFTVLISDDNIIEGPESIKLVLSNPTGAIFRGPADAPFNTSRINIVDNDFSLATSNPLDDSQFFVRQHYYDFLSRVPDQSGFDFWTGQITQCGSDQSCLRNKRIDVSDAFFYELEYQQTGSYVYRLYRAAFGNNQPIPNPLPDANNPGEEKKVMAYQAFVQDRARVVGGTSLAQAQLDLANLFVQRSEFLARYPANLDGPGFVDAVLTTIKNDLGADLTSQRQALIGLFNASGRGAVLYRLVDDNVQTNPINNRALIDAEYNRAFVATQYFGYLRRDPDMAGFLFWLGQVNRAPLRDVPMQHALVCSFITSTEYQERFSTVATHSNLECQQ
jgi:uncharacterized repeat protein (TIGR01451 family)